MIHVVVPVLAVAAHAVQVAERIQVLHQLVHAAVGVEIRRIRLLHAFAVRIDDVLRPVDHAHAGELLDGEVTRLLVAHRPERVALLAEVFQADPHRVVHVLDQVGAPVVEDLQTADLVARILHVDPAVRHDRRIAQRGDVGGVAQLQVLDQQAHGHEVAVRQAVGDLAHIGGHLRGALTRAQGVDQVLHRHGGDELVGLQLGAVALAILVHHGFDAAALLAHLDHVRVGDHTHTGALAVALHGLPQLAGPVLGVPELLDQAGLHLGGVLFLRQQFEERVLQHLGDAQALDALRAPVGRDLRGVPPPQLLGVALEEHRVQLAPETVDVEVLQIVLGQLVHHRLQIREPGLQRQLGAHGLERVRAQADRVVEEMPVPVDAGHAVPLEHHLVAGLRVRPARFQVVMAAELPVVVAGRTLQRQGVAPPLHDAVVLREEPVAADVHPVAVVLHRARDAAELAGRLQHGHVVRVRAAVLHQFPCGGQTGGAAADDHHGLLLRHVPFSLHYGKSRIVYPKRRYPAWGIAKSSRLRQGLVSIRPADVPPREYRKRADPSVGIDP